MAGVKYFQQSGGKSFAKTINTPIFIQNSGMKKIYFLICAITASFVANSQSLSPTVIAASGAYVVNQSANVSLSYTVGEMTMVQTFSSNGNILTQGFQQPYDTGTALAVINLSQGEFGSFVVYPNPAIDYTYYGFSLPESGSVSLAIFNELGQRVAEIYNSANYAANDKIFQQANTSTLAAGMYFVNMNFVSAIDGKAHTFTQKLQIVR